MENLNQQQKVSERVILVSVAVQMLQDLDAEEFHLLAQSAGADIVQHIHAQRIKPDAKLFIGSGKAEEIAEVVQQFEAELVIFDHALTPAQARNLERITKCRVVDRTELILDIFAQRARTYVGKCAVRAFVNGPEEFVGVARSVIERHVESLFLHQLAAPLIACREV